MAYSEFNTSVNINPAKAYITITPSDSSDLSSRIRALFVGGGGNAVIINNDPVFGTSTATFTGLIAGLIYPLQATRIKSTGTTATGLVGLQ